MTTEHTVTFLNNGAPFSLQFDDIYFDTEAGFQQSENVFIDGNKIYKRLLNNQQALVIGETGFGTGLNFLLTLRCYLAAQKQLAPKQIKPLTFISTEKYPLSKAQLTQALKALPALSSLAKLLTDQYPENCQQDVEISFLNGLVKLRLLIGDACEKFGQLAEQQSHFINTWYLDGFSPAKNPEMWQLSLYQQMAKLSDNQATLSTFTVAGKVRRELTKVGFRLEKIAGQGKKKQLLIGKFQQADTRFTTKQGYKIRPVIHKPQQVAIIGGGIAAACAAYSLTQQGIKVVVYCKDTTIAQGASSNAIGALFPLLHQQQDDISLFYQSAFWYALERYKTLLSQGHDFSHQWCGLLEISHKPALVKRQQLFEQLATWPKALIQSIDAKQASERANISLPFGGLFMPAAGWISPPELVKALFDAADKSGYLRIKTQTKITALKQTSDKQWQLITSNGEFSASTLVFCGGAESIKLNIINELPLSSVRGQVTNMASKADIKNLNTVICHKGYLTPAHNNVHCIGATFDKDSFETQSSTKDDEFNLTMLQQCLPDVTSWQKADIVSSKARLRCMTPDHLPMVGAMPNINAHLECYAHLRKDKNWRYSQTAPVLENIYLLTGLGARGLVSAPLLGDILAADLTGKPYPVDDEMLFNLSPNRFVIRDLIKRKC